MDRLKTRMMSAQSLILCDAIAEKFRCSSCNEFLSYSPIIIVLENGNRFCRPCAINVLDEPIARDSVLENILNLISFPCRFRKEGCTVRTLFDQGFSHQTKCNYRSFSCYAIDGCTWDGTALTFFDHIKKIHRELLMRRPAIQLKLTENKNGIFIFVEGSTTFIIKYFYNCVNRNLNYGIAHNSYDNESDVTFKITLMNGIDSVPVSPRNCPAFDVHFNDTTNEIVLNLADYNEVLKNLDSIEIFFNCTVNWIVQKLDLPRCKKCFNYLIPPLFMFEKKLVCYECGERYSASTPSNNELSQLLKQIDFPCYWRNCSFSGKYDVYKTHQASCKFYLQKCFFRKCQHYFRFRIGMDAREHNESVHSAEYFEGNLVREISFSTNFVRTCKHTIKGGVYILVKEYKKRGRYCLSVDSTNPESITVSVQFEHKHEHNCAERHAPIELPSTNILKIALDDLPRCFQLNDEITVTITIE